MMERMPEAIAAWRPQIRNWSWAFGSQATQIALRTASFFLVARALGVAQFGLFVSLTATTAIVSPLVGFGAAHLLIRDVARDQKRLTERWCKLVSTAFWSGIGLCAAAMVAVWLVIHGAVPVWEIAGFSISELLLLRFVQLIELTLQGLGLIHRMAQISILVNFSRLAISLVFFVLPLPLRDIHSWLQLYMANAVIVASCALWGTFRRFGTPQIGVIPTLKDLNDGFWFAISPLTQIVNNDADKLLLPRLAGLSSAGIYGAAYRILSAVFLPVHSILTVTYPHFFRKGSTGIRQSVSFAVRILPIALGYSFTAAMLLYWGAPLVSKILGPEYLATTIVLRYLTILPALRTVQYCFADAISGANFQNVRVTVQAAAALLNIALNILWIPQHGWMGAVWSTLISDGALALLLVVGALALSRRPATLFS
jgi:O-antigen/teichoic acid export membrane protein